MTDHMGKVCQVGLARALDSRVRRLLQNPDRILAGLIHKGDRVVDIGCGPGFFTSAMARTVGEEGKVVAVDLQPEMLDLARENARKEKLDSRIEFRECDSDRVGIEGQVDFALVFYVLHEMPNSEAFLRELHELLKPGGQSLLVEPKFHVSGRAFHDAVALARRIGFEIGAAPRIVLSRSVILRRAS